MATKKRKKRKSGLGSAAAPKKKGGKGLMIFLGLAALGTAGYFGYKHMTKSSSAPGASSMLPGASAAPTARKATIEDMKKAVVEEQIFYNVPNQDIIGNFINEPSLGAWTSGWFNLIEGNTQPTDDYSKFIVDNCRPLWLAWKKKNNLI